MKRYLTALLAGLLLCLNACDKRDEDVILPPSADEFPQVILFDDEEGGELEDADEFGFTVTLADRRDPEGEEPAGKVIPLQNEVVVRFEVDESEGIADLSSYILGGKAFYEVDDCTNSDDQGEDLDFTFDPVSGTGSFRFPAGVEEVEVEFETDEDYLNDDILNTEARNLSFRITSVESPAAPVVFNPEVSYTHEILDDEGIHGEWEIDPLDAGSFARFQQLFGLMSEDIRNLTADEVDKITINLEWSEVEVLVELKETEQVEECGEVEEVPKSIELELDIEELDIYTDAGEMELVAEVEDDTGGIVEIIFAGEYRIADSLLELILKGEREDEETEEIILTLSK